MTAPSDALLNDARRAVELGRDWLFSLLDDAPAWPVGTNGPLCAWTTGQVLGHLSPLSEDEYAKYVRATMWLEESQNADGSWTKASLPTKGTTPVTANATIALLRALGSASVSAQRGLAWLRQAYHDGWSTYHGPAKDERVPLNIYSTSYAIRALVKAPRTVENRATVSEGLSILVAAGIAEEPFGWGFNRDSPVDATFTSLALHGIRDAMELWSFRVPNGPIGQALESIVRAQSTDGHWPDWRTSKPSMEATAYSLYTLARWEHAPATADLATRALIADQLTSGGWGQDTSDDTARTWISWLAIMALETYVVARESKREPQDPGTPPVIGFGRALQDVYGTPTKSDISWIPNTRPMDHTMFTALDDYVERKVPTTQIRSAIERSMRIQVHGIFPPDARDVLRRAGYRSLRTIERDEHPSPKNWNKVRPQFFTGTTPDGDRAVIAAVIPGVDYVHHYATLMRHYALTLSTDAANLIDVFRYRAAEELGLPTWSRLPTNLIRAGDRVVLGYVDELLEEFGLSAAEVVPDTDGNYGIRRVPTESEDVVFLGVRYSYWGSISQHLVAELCRQGASEIIYVAKLGSLTSPHDVYKRIFVPSKFALVQHDEVQLNVPEWLPNRLLEQNPALNTGLHISVPTVLEEDYKQRQLASQLQANSIDNEIAHMAWAVSNHNARTDPAVSFSAVHFATDYVRGEHERTVPVEHNLASNREKAAIIERQKALAMIANVLRPYFRLRKPE